jgi:DNA-binding response OmpR family regulator
MRLLIAEEDEALAGFLRRGLETEGYQVQVTPGVQAGLEAILAETPDLAIFGMTMEGDSLEEGTRVLRTLRAEGANFPVIVLTAGSDVRTRLVCLDHGADECMFKPFSLQELRARCRALLRRAAHAPEPRIEVRDLSLDRIGRRVERGGKSVKLTNREYALLEQLVLERGRCVTRATLLERVWGLNASATNVVDVYINYLRRKLDDHGPLHLIETVRGQGYRIALTVVPKQLQGGGVDGRYALSHGAD